MMMFYANYGYHPSSGTIPTERNILSASSLAYGHWMKAVVENCKKELEKSSKRMKKYADQSRIKPPSFEPGNLVMLNGKNIKTRRQPENLNIRCTDYLRYLTSYLIWQYVFASPKCCRYTQSFIYLSLNLSSGVIATLI
jgi:hypothetical protein